jgi:hypothetical protein
VNNDSDSKDSLAATLPARPSVYFSCVDLNGFKASDSGQADLFLWLPKRVQRAMSFKVI